MVDERRAGAPHAAIVVAIVAAAVLLPTLLGEQGEAIINLAVSPVGVLLLCIVLVLTIQFLSSATVTGIFSSSAADRNSIHRVSASPVGVVIVLLLVLLLLYNKVSIFSGDDDSE